MARAGGRKKWVVGLLTVLGLTGIVLGWLYWNRPLTDRAARLKDSERRETDGKVWLPDRLRWLDLKDADDYTDSSSADSIGTRVMLHSLDRPDSKGKGIEAPAQIRSLQGVTPDYRLVASDWVPGAARVTVYEMGINANLTPERHFAFAAPRDATIVELSLSPQGDRIAWLFNYNRPMPFAGLLTRIFPTLKKNIHGIGLWVSRLDGKDLHEIGYQQSEEKDNVTYNVQDIRWLPEGKRVRFTYKNINYVAPAE